MSLSDTITADLTTAMKARDQDKLDTLRLIRAALKNEEIALGHPLTDDEAVKVLNRQIKQRTEASEQYKQANRTESADKEEAEAKIIAAYLPTQMDDEALRTLVAKTIADTKPTGPADFGKVMGQAMRQVGTGADGNRVSAIVRELLSAL